MLIEVNGLTEAAAPPDASLGDVVAGLRRRASSRRKVLGGLVLDGEPLTPEREESFAARPAAEFERLAADLKEPGEMVREVFLGLEAAIPAIAGRAVEAGGRIRVGVPAAPFIGKIAEDLAFVVDAYRTGLNLVGPDGPRDAPPRREASSRIEDVLNEVLSGIASEDMVAIGDVLEHQFGPALEALLLEIRERRSALGPEGGAAR